jgi:O-antigen biosynthesis protein
MPTYDRPSFVLQAVGMFQAQDYPRRELIIVDDAPRSRLQRLLPADERIRYVRSPRRESIGNKRNRACHSARGEFIAQWDDDDWYGPGRLSAQLAPLLARRADITGLTAPAFLDISSARCWTVTPGLHRRLFLDDVAAGTLAYRRQLWNRWIRYPNTSLGEDAAFLTGARRRGARLERVDGHGLFVYVRHNRNSWKFACGEHIDPIGWQRLEALALPQADRRFYDAFARPRKRSGRRFTRARRTLVTAIMPTKDRPQLVARAVDYFRRQDYTPRELIVIDDGLQPTGTPLPRDPNIRYLRLEHALSVGEKRNRACALARGAVIIHWDDDDWYAPHRISYQVAELHRQRADLCGLSRLLYFDPRADRSWLYRYPTLARPSWAAGSSLCYRIETWRQRPFPHVDIGEDGSFVAARRSGSLLLLGDHRFMVALLHAANTASRVGSQECWRERPVAEVKAILGDDYGKYRNEVSAR